MEAALPLRPQGRSPRARDVMEAIQIIAFLLFIILVRLIPKIREKAKRQSAPAPPHVVPPVHYSVPVSERKPRAEKAAAPPEEVPQRIARAKGKSVLSRLSSKKEMVIISEILTRREW